MNLGICETDLTQHPGSTRQHKYGLLYIHGVIKVTIILTQGEKHLCFISKLLAYHLIH